MQSLSIDTSGCVALGSKFCRVLLLVGDVCSVTEHVSLLLHVVHHGPCDDTLYGFIRLLMKIHPFS